MYTQTLMGIGAIASSLPSLGGQGVYELGAVKKDRIKKTSSQKNARELDKLEKAINVTKASASLVSSASGALVAFGSGASAVPVVGWVAAAVAFVASMVVNLISSQKIARQLYKQKKQIDAALKEITTANVQADQVIAKLEPELAHVKTQLGLSGLGVTWFEKKFYAGNTAQNAVDLSIAKYDVQFAQLERSLGEKIKRIQKIETELKSLQQKVTGKATTTQAVKAGGLALGVFALLIVGGMMLKNKKKATA